MAILAYSVLSAQWEKLQIYFHKILFYLTYLVLAMYASFVIFGFIPLIIIVIIFPSPRSGPALPPARSQGRMHQSFHGPAHTPQPDHISHMYRY